MINNHQRYERIPDCLVTGVNISGILPPKDIIDDKSELPRENEYSSYPSHDTLLDSLYFYAPLILFVSLLLGTSFYRLANNWSLSTCYFYSAQALLGDMYGVPGDECTVSKAFTLVYFIYGEFLLAGALARFADRLISLAPAIALDERLRVKREEATDVDGDGVVGCVDILDYNLNNLLVTLIY